MINSPEFARAKTVACYLANDGEIDLGRVIEAIWARGKTAYVPVLFTPKLWFYPLSPDTPLQRNRFGIWEPALAPSARCHVHRLDLVLVPLVAFDSSGNRLGMGGGYYDQTFGFQLVRKYWKRPTLLGVAYELQRKDDIAAQRWDVPLAGVVTERTHYRFS